MPDLWMDVDTALAAVPVNVMPLLDDTDFKTRETGIVYNQAGMDLVWNFVTTGGAYTQTAVTPTDGTGNYDWTHKGDGMYSIEIPASGGASINNDTEGFGWFTGICTGVLAWRGPVIGFRAAAVNNSLVDGATIDVNATALANGVITAAKFAAGAIDAAAIATGAIDADALAADAVAEIADGVWDEDATGHQTQGTFGQVIGDSGADADSIWGLANTNLDAAVSSRASQTSVNTIDDLLDTEISTIMSDLDDIQTRLPAALVGGKMDSDMTAISGDTAAADNLEKEYDGTGYGQILQRTTIATLSTQTSFTLTAGSADNDAYNGCVMVIEDAATAAQKAVAVIGDYVGATKTITLLNDPAIFTMAVGDIVTIIADRALKPTVDNRTLDVSSTGEAGLDWANVGSPTTAQTLSGTTIKTATDVETDTQDIQARLPAALVAGRMDSNTQAMAAGVITAAVIATDAIDGDAIAASAVSEIQSGLALSTQVDDLETRLGTPSDLGGGATIAANLADIEAQTDDIGVAGAGLTAVPWNAAWDAEVQSEVDDALVARNLDKLVLVSGTAGSGSTTTMVDAARTEGDADYWKGRLILFTSGNIANQCAIITDFNQTTDTFTFAPPLTQAVTTQNYVILPQVSVWDDTLAEHLISGSTGSALNAAGSAGDPWATSLPGAYGAGTAGKIVGDNLNTTVSSRASQSSVDTIDDLLDTEVAAILEDTGTTLPAQISGLNNLSAAQAADAVWDEARADHVAAGSFGQGVASVQGNVTGSVASLTTNNDKTGYSLSAAGVQAVWDALTTALTTAGSIGKRIADFLTGDAFVRLGAPAGASVSADIAAVKAQTAAIETDTQSIETKVDTVDTNVDAILVDTGTTLQAELDGIQADTEDIQTRLPAALTAGGNMKADALAINGSTDAAAQLARSAATIVNAAAIAGTLSTTEMTTDLTETTNDHYNGRIIIWTSGALLNQATDITDYDGGTKKLTYTAITEAPTAGDTFIIV